MSEAVDVETGELVEYRPQPSPIVRAAAGDVAEAFAEYQRIQKTLDAQLPDCILEIQGRQFRKKNYWRAIATAFNLTVEPIEERREQDGDDWGYVVTYRATAPNGRSTVGDGACMASEKRGPQGTLHNVRSHAHTRGFNRAVSNLVGFGEVSADEITQDAPRHSRGPAPARPTPQQERADGDPVSQDTIDKLCHAAKTAGGKTDAHPFRVIDGSLEALGIEGSPKGTKTWAAMVKHLKHTLSEDAAATVLRYIEDGANEQEIPF